MPRQNLGCRMQDRERTNKAPWPKDTPSQQHLRRVELARFAQLTPQHEEGIAGGDWLCYSTWMQRNKWDLSGG